MDAHAAHVTLIVLWLFLEMVKDFVLKRVQAVTLTMSLAIMPLELAVALVVLDYN